MARRIGFELNYWYINRRIWLCPLPTHTIGWISLDLAPRKLRLGGYLVKLVVVVHAFCFCMYEASIFTICWNNICIWCKRSEALSASPYLSRGSWLTLLLAFSGLSFSRGSYGPQFYAGGAGSSESRNGQNLHGRFGGKPVRNRSTTALPTEVLRVELL